MVTAWGVYRRPAPAVPLLYASTTPRHTLENTDTDDLVVIGVDLKRPTAG